MNNATSFSDIATFQRCPKKYEYRAIKGLQRKVLSKDLFLGSEVHEMLKVWFLTLQEFPKDYLRAKMAIEQYADDRMSELAKIKFENELDKADLLLEDARQLVLRYVIQNTAEWQILHVEEEFYATIGSRVVSFTPDLVVADSNNSVWIVDHKTTSRMPQGGVPFGDLQALLYFSGVQALYDVKGFIFNRMRKKVPTTPRLNKTRDKESGLHFVSDLQRIDTTYEVLRDFIQENAPKLMSHPAHQRRLATLRDEPDRFFWTETVYVNDETVQQVLADVTSTLESMEAANYVTGYPRHFQEDGGYLSCGKCPFKRLCQGELVGWDTETILAEDYEPRSEKNPYESEDDE